MTNEGEVQAEQQQEEESPLDAAAAEQEAGSEAEAQDEAPTLRELGAAIDAEVNPDTPLDEFLGDDEDEPDLGVVIYITSSGTGRMVVPVAEDHTYNNVPGYSIRELLFEASLTVRPGSTQFWVEGNQVEIDFVVPIGATVTIIGPVKGG